MNREAMEVREVSPGYALKSATPTVPEGYKQTVVGVIPADWEASTLSQACSMKSGESITSATINQNAAYPCYGGNGLRGFTNQYTHNGRHALIGRQGALCGNVVGVQGKFFASEHAVVVTAKSGNDINWLTYVLDRMNLNRFSESSAQPGISVSKVLGLSLARPTTEEEQRAIATALSDVDALLEELDRLIAKKRGIKKATMQQLLTGQTRLPGFEGEWELKLLSDICWFPEVPRGRNYQFTPPGVKLFNGTNLENGRVNLDKTNRHISEKEAYGYYSHFLAEAGDIVIACSGISVDKFEEKVSIIEEDHLPICMNTSTMRFKTKPQHLKSEFFIQFLRSSEFKQQIGGSATGSAQLNFGPSHVSKASILAPSLKEQSAIGSVLSDIDSEIRTLEKRHTKIVDLKQAMMQELLTGRTRLIQK